MGRELSSDLALCATATPGIAGYGGGDSGARQGGGVLAGHLARALALRPGGPFRATGEAAGGRRLVHLPHLGLRPLLRLLPPRVQCR